MRINVYVYVECAKAGGAPCVGGPGVLHLVTSWSPVAQVTMATECLQLLNTLPNTFSAPCIYVIPMHLQLS